MGWWLSKKVKLYRPHDWNANNLKDDNFSSAGTTPHWGSLSRVNEWVTCMHHWEQSSSRRRRRRRWWVVCLVAAAAAVLLCGTWKTGSCFCFTILFLFGLRFATLQKPPFCDTSIRQEEKAGLKRQESFNRFLYLMTTTPPNDDFPALDCRLCKFNVSISDEI